MRDALAETGKVGLGTYVLRNKESIGVIKPHEDILVLNKIRFGEEIRDTSELDSKRLAKSNPAELKMAIALINQLSGDFDISHLRILIQLTC